jgi:SAM-dependent methyltransferase
MLRFNDEGLRLISDYVEDVETEIRKISVNVEPEYMKMLAFDIENYVKFFGVKEATKHRSTKVEAADVMKALKRFGKPKEFVKSQFRNEEAFLNSQKIALSNLKAIGEKLKEIEAPRVLDAGCGWGRVSKKLQDYTRVKDLEIIGIDLNKLSLQYGKTVNKDAAFFRSDIQAPPFENQVFDIILSSGVIHEVKSMKGRSKAIKEFSRILKPNGVLYIIDAFTESCILSAFTFIMQHIIHNVEWIPKKEAIEKMLKEAKLKTFRVEKGSFHLLGMVTSYTIAAIKEP